MEKYCQSCGMPMIEEEDTWGTFSDGTPNSDYCSYCYRRGAFLQDCTMNEMIELCAQDVDEINPLLEEKLTKREAVERMVEEFPKLKRWMPIEQKAQWVLEQCAHIILSSITQEGYPRPLAIGVAKHQGIDRLWMATALSSQKVTHFRSNPKAGVCFVRNGDSVSLTGEVEVIADSIVKQECWNNSYFRFFSGGPQDEDYCLLCFRAKEATFWIDGEFVHKILHS